MKFCNICNKAIKQLQNRNRNRCSGCTTKMRRYRTKMAAVKLLGGSCTKCGYNKNISAFEFHHLDPSQKDFNIGNAANKSWEVIKKEIQKCVLLCANCHKIEHSDFTKLKDQIVKYNGKDLN